MESLQNIKRRIKGVGNISKITKAMEMVAATKMRRSQEIAIASRPYAFAALEILANLSLAETQWTSPLLEKRRVLKTALVLVSSDKGLAGSFNGSVFKNFEKFLKRGNINPGDPSYLCVAIGQKAANYAEKRFGVVAKKFVRVGDFTSVEEVQPIAEFLLKGYSAKEWDRVIVFSTNFRSALKQEVIERQLFPVDFESVRNTVLEILPERGHYAEIMKESGVKPFGENLGPNPKEYLIEPSPEEVLQNLIPRLITMEIYHLVLEANASEHAARRVAMKNASDSAEDLASGLTASYNKSRQAAITREIAEITAGAGEMK